MNGRLRVAPWAVVLLLSGAAGAGVALGVCRHIAKAAAAETIAGRNRIEALVAEIAAKPGRGQADVMAARRAAGDRRNRLARSGSLDRFLANLGPDWELASRSLNGGGADIGEERAEISLRPSGLDRWNEVLHMLGSADSSGIGVFGLEARTKEASGGRVFDVVRIDVGAISHVTLHSSQNP